MIKAFYYTKRWALWAYGGGFLLISSLWLQVQMTVALNEWYRDFYDLIQNASDYKDNSKEGINLFFSKIISLDYIFEKSFETSPSFLVIAAPLHCVGCFYILVYCNLWLEMERSYDI